MPSPAEGYEEGREGVFSVCSEIVLSRAPGPSRGTAPTTERKFADVPEPVLDTLSVREEYVDGPVYEVYVEGPV